MPLSLAPNGAELCPASLNGLAIAGLAAMLDHLPPGRPGARLSGIDGLRPLLTAAGMIGSIAASVLGPGCHPVRALLLDKSPAANWALGWHQDRTVAVTGRVDTPGFANWNVKAGLLHVEPPWTVIAGMVTLRVHIDAAPAGNAPLLIAPGSHRLGRVPETAIADAVARLGTAACLAEAGDVWVYSTPILHASERATAGGRRRVLQVDYAAEALPNGLEWLGV